MKEAIRFSNLSIWLKTLVILGWCYTVIFGLAFLIAFIAESIAILA